MSLAAIARTRFSFPAQICTQGQVMFPAHSANMVCAVCVSRVLDGRRTLFENLGSRFTSRCRGAGFSSNTSASMRQILIDIWRLEIVVNH